MGTVRKRSNGDGTTSWMLDYRGASGGRVREIVRGATTKKAAEAVLRMRLAAIVQGREGLPTHSRLTFRQFADDWFERHRLRLKGHAYGGSTVGLYRGYLDRDLFPQFGDLLLRAIGKVDVERFVAAHHERGLAAKSINNLLAFLKTILSAAEEEGHIEKNPARQVRPLRVPKRRVEVYTPEEVRALLAAADMEAYPLLLAALTTGFREGELFALRWSDVDFQSGTLTVRRRYYRGHFDDPKTTESARTIAIPQVLSEALTTLRRRQAERKLSLGAGWHDHDLVFAGPDGRPLHQSWAERALHRTARKAGLRALRIHDLRHCHASLLIAMGENIKTVGTRLGHTDVRTTLSLYTHLLPEADRTAAGRMDEMLGHALGTRANGKSRKPRHDGEISGSAGRIRTYNPPVNSRTLYR